MSRWVVVDDTAPSITYTGPWFLSQATQNSLGNFGPPYLSTLHGTNSNASFSYSFHGTIVIITGTNPFTNLSGVTNPSRQCVVDGVSVPSAAVSVPENRLLFCEKDGLSDGLHVVNVNVSLSINANDPEIQYGTGWSPIYPGNMTGQTGSTFSFEFNGISLIWLGFYLNSLPNASTTATYAIDGQSPVTFGLNGASSECTGVEYNQVFFQTNQLPYGSHKLDVVYQGNSQTTPLTLTVLVQNNASSSPSSGTPAVSSAGSLSHSVGLSTVGSSSTSEQTTSTTTILSPSNASSKTKDNLGSIIGGVVGGLALLIFFILAVFFFQRKKRSQKTDSIVKPFVGHSSTVPVPLPQNYSQQYTRNLDAYETTNNANTTFSLSPPPLTPNRGLSPTLMIPVNNGTPSLSHGLREQRKGEHFIGRPLPLQETCLSPSITGNNHQPTGLPRDVDAGIQLARTDQHGELPPPVYSF